MSNKVEQLLRGLTTSNTDALQKEDLSELLTLVTPTDVKLFPRLGTVKVTAMTHEWVEADLDSTITHGIYTEGDLPTDNENTYTRKSNNVAAFGKVAKVTGLMQKVAIVQGAEGKIADAFANEIALKMTNLIRTIEYYLWRGDATNSGEFDGVLEWIPSGNTVDMGTTTLTEAKLHEALKECYDNGGNPTAIYCRPGVAFQIADFANDKVQYTVNVDEQAHLIGGVKVQKYLSPLGTLLDVIPVREDFLPSGKVVILDESKVKVGWLSDQIEIMPVELGKDNMAKLLKAYLTLEFRAPSHHALIENVVETVV